MAPATRKSSAFLFALCADLHWHAALYAFHSTPKQGLSVCLGRECARVVCCNPPSDGKESVDSLGPKLLMRVCVHPTTALDGPRSPGRVACFVHVPSALVRSEDAKRDNHAACNDRKLATASQDHCWIRLGSAAGCSRQRGAACQATPRRSPYQYLPRDRERTLCHVMVITDSMWELSPVATHIIHVSQLRVYGFLHKVISIPTREEKKHLILIPTAHHGYKIMPYLYPPR